jgi:hypothetical protein
MCGEQEYRINIILKYPEAELRSETDVKTEQRNFDNVIIMMQLKKKTGTKSQ